MELRIAAENNNLAINKLFLAVPSIPGREFAIDNAIKASGLEAYQKTSIGKTMHGVFSRPKHRIEQKC